MWKCRFLVLAILVLFAFGIGCSGGNNIEGPVGPDNEGQPAGSISGTMAPSNPVVPGSGDQPSVAVPNGTMTVLGLWEVTIDKEAGTIEAVDMRTSSLIINVLGFLEPPPMTGMKIDFSTLVIADPVVEVDVIVTHPLPDAVFTGFDVRGVVFGPEVKNADGLTIIPSPEFFKSVPFGYKDGILGAPDSYAHYTGLAGYKYFCDGLAKDGDLVTFMSDPANLAKRGVFSPKPQKNIRHYVLDWSGSSLGFMVFNYAIYANFNWPTGTAPYDISDFDITTANSAEAFCAKVTETANTLWYSGGSGGGALSLDVEVWDWQGNVADVSVKSLDPGVIAESFFDVFVEVSPYHDTFKFIDVPGTPTAVGDLVLLITATDPVMFGNAWFGGMLPTSNPMYQKPVYNCWKYTTKVIECPQPNPTSVLPGSHAPDNVKFSAVINGTNFVGGPSLAVKVKKTGQTDLPVTNVAYVGPTQITCDITVPLNTALGLWDVEVVNGCSVIGTGLGLFEVVCPTPTVTAINPPTRDANGVAFGATITGSNFVAGTSLAVALTRTGYSNINATSPVVTSATQITCTLNLPLGTATGLWNVRVTNGCGTQGTGANLLTVTCPTPTVTAINPNNHYRDGVSFGATITGNYFTAGSSLAVALINALAPGPINATSPAVTSATQITCTLNIPVSATTGLWDVRVTNGCGGTAGTGKGLFTVNVAPVAGPKNINLRKGVTAWDLAVDPKTGDVFILYKDLQIWRHQTDAWTTGKYMTTTKDPIGGKLNNGWMDIGWERFMIVGLDYLDGPPYAAWIHHDQNEPFDPISQQVEEKYGYHAYGDVMASYEGGPQGPHAHHGVFGYVSKDCMTYIWHTQEFPFDPVQMEYTWKSPAPDYSRSSFMATLIRGLEWGQDSEYFWAVKGGGGGSGAYAAAFRLEGDQIMYWDRYFGYGTPGDKDDYLNDARDITRTIKYQNVVVDILSKYNLRLKGWDNDPPEPSPCTALGGMDITGLNGKPSEPTYRLRIDAEDNYHPKYGNILFILHGDDVNGYFLSLYYPSELTAWWPK